ncbi:MAB_1171c family putative transporter [Streptomyces xylophagus]|uniref:MAB_1171c family putative transporter n=1 Tax=Streptomyces xylophagus TaxID=285514 RepID=UPI0005BC98A4|nr:MAB_1171c family putative transporter [Streptomyces xylophagus]
MTFCFHIPYSIPTALLATAVLLKLPTFVRAWRDPNVKATTLLLSFATAVNISVTPVNIKRLNHLTGVPNIASPWIYSFLTAFCATALTMIMRWREEPSPQRQRRMRRIYWIYAGIVVMLWVTFLLAHVPEPRIYDLDTYYASTPWMSEHILLYLGAHMVTSLVAAYMLVKWFPEVENRWLKSGVVFLQLGFASGLVFDGAKLAAISARWSGHNWDGLSTNIAPPFALLAGILVAMGFIVPQAGPLQQKWIRDRREYWRLRSLWRALRDVTPSSARARFGLWVPLDLRLVQRQQRIHDALRVLAPYFDQDLYQRACRATPAGYAEEKAHDVARAVTVRAAIDAHCGGRPCPESLTARQLEFGTDIHEHIDTIAQALHRPRLVDSIRQRVTTESADTYAS